MHLENKRKIAGVNLTMITLNGIALNNKIRRQKIPDWIVFLRIKIQLHDVYRRHTLLSKIQIGQKLNDGKRYHANRNHKRIEVDILLSDKNFKILQEIKNIS